MDTDNSKKLDFLGNIYDYISIESNCYGKEYKHELIKYMSKCLSCFIFIKKGSG